MPESESDGGLVSYLKSAGGTGSSIVSSGPLSREVPLFSPEHAETVMIAKTVKASVPYGQREAIIRMLLHIFQRASTFQLYRGVEPLN